MNNYKTFKEMKEYDTIEVKKALSLDELDIAMNNADFQERYPFGKEFVIKFNALDLNVKIFGLYNFNEEIIEVGAYYIKDYLYIPIFKIDLTQLKEDIDFKLEINDKFKGYNFCSEDNCKPILYQVLSTYFYILNEFYNRDTKIVINKKEKTNKTVSKNNTDSKRQIKVLNKEKVIYNIMVSEENISNFKKRVFNRKTETWKVMGHYREYKKTGKKIWVDAYIKGDKNSKTIPQKYYIK